MAPEGVLTCVKGVKEDTRGITPYSLSVRQRAPKGVLTCARGFKGDLRGITLNL